MPTAPTSHAPFDHPHIELTARRAGLATRRIEADDLRLRVGLQAHALARDEAGGDHVALDHAADGREDGWDVFALHPSPTARVEDSLEFLNHKGHVTTTAEHGRDHPRQRHGPGEMLHVLGVDEDLKGATMAVQHDVVDGDV